MPKGVLGTTSWLATGSHARMIDGMSLLVADQLARLICTTFGNVNPLAKEPHMLEAKKAEAHAKEVKLMLRKWRKWSFMLQKQQK